MHCFIWDSSNDAQGLNYGWFILFLGGLSESEEQMSLWKEQELNPNIY